MSRLFASFVLVSLCAVLSACGQSSSPTPPQAAAPSSAPAPAAAPEPNTAALASLPAPYNTGDPDNGQAKFALCQACHSVVKGAPNMIGPNLYGIFGRKAGSLPGFAYSDAMKAKGDWTWDAQHIDAWIAGPAKVIPGTKMTFVGLPSSQDRVDVIAYLRTVTGP